MQHEALSVYSHADPLNIAVHLRVPHFEADHIPLDRLVIEGFPYCVIMEVAADQLTIRSIKAKRRTVSPGIAVPAP